MLIRARNRKEKAPKSRTSSKATVSFWEVLMDKKPGVRIYSCEGLTHDVMSWILNALWINREFETNQRRNDEE